MLNMRNNGLSVTLTNHYTPLPSSPYNLPVNRSLCHMYPDELPVRIISIQIDPSTTNPCPFTAPSRPDYNVNTAAVCCWYSDDKQSKHPDVVAVHRPNGFNTAHAATH